MNGFGENSLAKPLFEKKNINTTLILPSSASDETYLGKVQITYPNKELQEEGVQSGDTLFMNKLGGINYWIDGEKFWWIRNTDILGKQL